MYKTNKHVCRSCSIDKNDLMKGVGYEASTKINSKNEAKQETYIHMNKANII